MAPPPSCPPYTDLPDALLRDIFGRLGLEDKLRASMVCRDFHRLLLTVGKGDEGCFGEVTIGFLAGSLENAGSWLEDNTLRLIPSDRDFAGRALACLLGGKRAHRFSTVRVWLTPTNLVGQSDAGVPAESERGMLFMILGMLAGSEYPGMVRVDDLYVGGEATAHDVMSILTSFPLRLTLGRTSIAARGAVSHLPRLAKAKRLAAIESLSLPAVPALDYTAMVSVLEARLQHLEIGGYTVRCSLTQIQGLAGLASLSWNTHPESPADAYGPLKSLKALTSLTLGGVVPQAWPSLCGALPALSSLHKLMLGIVEPGAFFPGNVEFGGLGPLGPLRVPRSLRALHLLAGRLATGLGLLQGTSDIFSEMPFVEVLAIDLIVSGARTGDDGSMQYVLELGPSLGKMAALRRLKLRANEAAEHHAAFHFPASLSCLTALEELVTEGSCGINRFGGYPEHWVVKGFKDAGRDACYSHPVVQPGAQQQQPQ